MTRAAVLLLATIAPLSFAGCKQVESDGSSARGSTVKSPPPDMCIHFPPEPPVDMVWISPDLTLPPGAGDLPPIACGDAGACPLPHSRCVDENTIVYYSNGRCQD